VLRTQPDCNTNQTEVRPSGPRVQGRDHSPDTTKRSDTAQRSGTDSSVPTEPRSQPSTPRTASILCPAQPAFNGPAQPASPAPHSQRPCPVPVLQVRSDTAQRSGTDSNAPTPPGAPTEPRSQPHTPRTQFLEYLRNNLELRHLRGVTNQNEPRSKCSINTTTRRALPCSFYRIRRPGVKLLADVSTNTALQFRHKRNALSQVAATGGDRTPPHTCTRAQGPLPRVTALALAPPTPPMSAVRNKCPRRQLLGQSPRLNPGVK